MKKAEKSPEIIDLKSVPPMAKSFLDKVFVPFLKLKFGEETLNWDPWTKTYEPESGSDLMFEQLYRELNDIFYEYSRKRNEIKSKP